MFATLLQLLFTCSQSFHLQRVVSLSRICYYQCFTSYCIQFWEFNCSIVHNTSFFGFNAPKLKIYVGGTENNICHALFSTSKDNCNCTMLWAIGGQLQKVPVWKDSKVAAVFHSGRAISSPCVLSSKNPNQSWGYPDDLTTQVLKIPMTCQPLLFWRFPIYEPGQLLGTTQCARWPSSGTSTNLKEHPTAKSNTISKGSFISGEVQERQLLWQTTSPMCRLSMLRSWFDLYFILASKVQRWLESKVLVLLWSLHFSKQSFTALAGVWESCLDYLAE